MQQTGSGNYAFPTRVTVRLEQIPKQVYLKVVSRCEVRVASFAGERMKVLAVPVGPGFTKPGARRYHRSVASIWRPGVEHCQVFLLEHQSAVGVCHKIIDEPHGLDAQLASQRLLVDDPWEVRSFDSLVLDRAGNPETGVLNREPVMRNELAHDLIQTLVPVARVVLFDNQIQSPAFDCKKSEPS